MRDSEMKPIVFVVPGDLHLTEAGLENHRAAIRVIGEINGLIKPDFVQFIGDNVQHARDEEFQLFRELTEKLHVPWHALVGDHDIHADPDAVRFRHWVGPMHGSTVLRGFRFVRLNTQESRPIGMSDEQITWFESELASGSQHDEQIVVFQHNYPYQIWEEFSGPGIDSWRALVQTWRIAAIFTGHTHYGQIANDGRNVCITTRSIGDPEGGPAGYTIAYLHGDDLAVTYRSIEDEGPIVLITHPRTTLLATGSCHVVRAADEIRARIWSTVPIIAARARIDDGQSLFLQRIGEQDWSLEIPRERLTKGEHRLTIEISDQEGRCSEQSICFPVDPTGRFTAVPTVEPIVHSTKYC